MKTRRVARTLGGLPVQRALPANALLFFGFRLDDSELKALIAIANPPNLDQAINPEDPQKGFPAVDVAGEKDRALKGLSAAGFTKITTLATAPSGTAPPTR